MTYSIFTDQMFFVMLGIGALFIGMAFLLNKSNAKLLLSGYNTMSAEKQAKFPIEAYLKRFKQFHLYLGVSFIAVGTLVGLLFGTRYLGLFIGLYPLFAYAYFIYNSKEFDENRKRMYQLAAVSLVVMALVIAGLFFRGLEETKIQFSENAITITGSYGLTVQSSELVEIHYFEDFSKFKATKRNGFAIDKIKKGKIKTASGDVLLLINDTSQPVIGIKRMKEKPIYVSGTFEEFEQILELESKNSR